MNARGPACHALPHALSVSQPQARTFALLWRRDPAAPHRTAWATAGAGRSPLTPLPFTTCPRRPGTPPSLSVLIASPARWCSCHRTQTRELWGSRAAGEWWHYTGMLQWHTTFSPRPVWGSPALVAPAFATRIHGVSPSTSFSHQPPICMQRSSGRAGNGNWFTVEYAL